MSHPYFNFDFLYLIKLSHKNDEDKFIIYILPYNNLLIYFGFNFGYFKIISNVYVINNVMIVIIDYEMFLIRIYIV